MKTGAIIQSRLSSTRLPGKIFNHLPYRSGVSVVQHVINRVQRAKFVDQIVIATTTNSADDPLVGFAKQAGIPCFRGSEDDVLERTYLAASAYKLDQIVRITSDCPCIDPATIDRVIAAHLGAGADYTSNVFERSFPHGLDVEAFSFAALKAAYQNAAAGSDREHVTSYIRNNPQQFQLHSVTAHLDQHGPKIRVTIDTKQDYALLCVVFALLYPQDHCFGPEQLVTLFNENPWLYYINEDTRQKQQLPTLAAELHAASSILGLQDLNRAKDYIDTQIIPNL